MKTLFRKSILATALALPVMSHAGGIYLYEIGTSDLGFAGAGTAARAEDASTIFGNPAGMTRLAGDQLIVGAQALYGRANYELDGTGALGRGDPDNSLGWLPGGSAFYSHSVSDRLKLGVGFYGNFGLAEDFGKDWAGKNLADKVSLMGMTIQPTLAYRLDDQWSLGVALTANYGLIDLERTALVGGAHRKQDDSDWAYGSRLSVLYEPTRTTRFGLVWTSEVEYEFAVDATLTGILGRTHTLPIGAKVIAPQQVMASAYHQLNDRWSLMGNLGWQDWSEFGNTSLEVNGATTTSSLKVQDTWHVAFGAQYAYNATTKVNAGLAYDTSFYKHQNQTSFAMPSGDTWRLGAGVQYTLSPKSDLGLAFEYLRTDSSSDPSGLVSGSYDHPDMLFMSAHYAYRF